MLALLLSLTAAAESPAQATPAFVFNHTMLYETPSTESATTPLTQRADLVVTGPSQKSDIGPAMLPVRLADGKEGFIQSGQVAKRVNADGEMHYYLTDHRLDGSRASVEVVMTDRDGELVSHAPGPASSGERFHRITHFELPGVDELIVIEAYRQSCPGGAQWLVLARSGAYLTAVTTVHTSGEEGWHNTTEIYRPVTDADGVLRFRHLTEDTYLTEPVIRARPGVLIEVESVHEPWGDGMGRSYTLRRASQRVIEWSIEPED
ncbi:MAG: hypothetical protein ACI8RZ_006430 [Myxococcota bacterium]|jgi:hypothetical protein